MGGRVSWYFVTVYQVCVCVHTLFTPSGLVQFPKKHEEAKLVLTQHPPSHTTGHRMATYLLLTQDGPVVVMVPSAAMVTGARLVTPNTPWLDSQ